VSLELHRQAELLMGRADQMSVEGRLPESADLNRQAAELEAEVFGMVPVDRPKTRGVTAVSSVALYRKAGALNEAIQQAESFLECDELPEFARLDLEEMVEEMRAEIEAGASVERTAL
jgi:hypothetical protein